MKIELEKMGKDEKVSFFAAVIALISFVLPWYGSNYEPDQAFAAIDREKIVSAYEASNPYLKGFEIDLSFLGILALALTIYLIINKNKYAVFTAAASMLYALNAYFKISEKINLIAGTQYMPSGGLLGGTLKGGFKFGFFIFIISGALLLFKELKMAGYIDKIVEAKRLIEQPKDSNPPG